MRWFMAVCLVFTMVQCRPGAVASRAAGPTSGLPVDPITANQDSLGADAEAAADALEAQPQLSAKEKEELVKKADYVIVVKEDGFNLTEMDNEQVLAAVLTGLTIGIGLPVFGLYIKRSKFKGSLATSIKDFEWDANNTISGTRSSIVVPPANGKPAKNINAMVTTASKMSATIRDAAARGRDFIVQIPAKLRSMLPEVQGYRQTPLGGGSYSYEVL